MRRVLIVGSTGSVGTQALALIARHPDELAVAGLVAGGSRPDLLAEQAARFPDAQVATGIAGALKLIDEVEADVVLNAVVGSIGLAPTLAALATGRPLALANKESLVAGGPLVLAAAAPGQLISVDSEHSAIAQCLRSGRPDEVAQLVLTASGGPFRGRQSSELTTVTVEQAMAHPTWDMGPVITINSATLVNKGLELIEAHLLFGVPYERIETVVHPQSIVHSMVTFRDGATVAQASPPDMGLPIALGLTWPDRLSDVVSACDFTAAQSWTFEPVDHQAFPALGLARRAGVIGGLVPATFNAANEVAVEAFRTGNLSFPGIAQVLTGIIDQAEQSDALTRDPQEGQDVWAAEAWARDRAQELLGWKAGATH